MFIFLRKITALSSDRCDMLCPNSVYGLFTLLICYSNSDKLQLNELSQCISLMSGKDELYNEHLEKWKRWKEGEKPKEVVRQANVGQAVQKYAVNLIAKISSKPTKNNAKSSNEVNQQIESNVCSICLQLMIPPTHQPMILIPCGHNICKDCLCQKQPGGRMMKNPVLRLKKCPNCRTQIESFTLNRSLMTLICTYSNNKQLLEKELALQEEVQSKQTDIEQLRIRCEILERERKEIWKAKSQCTKNKAILLQVIETLNAEKKRNAREMQKLQAEAKLINRHLADKTKEMEHIDKKLEEISEKDNIVEKALVPLTKEKEKLELLQIARILQKK